MAGGRASAYKLKVAERRQMAVDLRKAGHSYRKIAELMRQHPGVSDNYSESMAHRDVTAALEYAREKMAESAAAVLALELARLDVMTVAWWTQAVGLEHAGITLPPAGIDDEESDPGRMSPEAQLAQLKPDEKAAKIVLEIMKRRAAMLGLDKMDLHLSGPGLQIQKPGPGFDELTDDELNRIIENLQAATGSSPD